jgi:hypothetical protein
VIPSRKIVFGILSTNYFTFTLYRQEKVATMKVMFRSEGVEGEKIKAPCIINSDTK